MNMKETGRSGNPWTPFILESVRFWGLIPTERDWREVVERFKEEGGICLLVRAHIFSVKLTEVELRTPRFGFTVEHRGPITLGEWAHSNNMML